MTALARNSLLFLLVLLPACAGADQANFYRNAGIKQMPRSLEDLKLVKTDERLTEIRTPVSGEHHIIRYEATSSGVPFIADSGSRQTVVVVLDGASPVVGSHEVGKGILSAYRTSGPPSMAVGAYCLGVATTGFVDIKSKASGLYDVVFDLKFSEISAADFEGVCDGDHFKETMRDLRLSNLK